MYRNTGEDKFFRCWVIGSTLGLITGVVAGFSSAIFIDDLYNLSYVRVMASFVCGSILGLFLGFFQGLALPKLLKEKGLSTNIRKIIIKWVFATSLSLSIGFGITGLWTGLNLRSPVKLVLAILFILILLSLTQGLMMNWHIKKIYKWLFVNIVSVLASAVVGVFLYFVSASIAVGFTGGGLPALGLVLIIAPLLISLSSGLIYGAITGFFLPDLLNKNTV